MGFGYTISSNVDIWVYRPVWRTTAKWVWISNKLYNLSIDQCNNCTVGTVRKIGGNFLFRSLKTNQIIRTIRSRENQHRIWILTTDFNWSDIPLVMIIRMLYFILILIFFFFWNHLLTIIIYKCIHRKHCISYKNNS